MFSSSVSSMSSHAGWMNNTAHNVANINTDKFAPLGSAINEGVKGEPTLITSAGKNSRVDEKSSTDLAKEMTDMVVSSSGFAVNAPVIKTKDEMLGTLLNMKT